MFEIGDTVLYPLYGVGTIRGIREMEVLGNIGRYYVLEVAATGMSVMLPIADDKNLGLREVVDKETALSILESFAEIQADSCQNWNKRYRENMELLKTGTIAGAARVVRSLMGREIAKGLSTGERRMYVQAKQILLSELEVATGISAKELELRLYNSLTVS